MKSNTKKRILAIVLCMVLMLSSSISTMADGVLPEEAPAPGNTESQEPAAVSAEGETPAATEGISNDKTESQNTEDSSTEDGNTEAGSIEDSSTETGSLEDGNTEAGSMEDGSTETDSTAADNTTAESGVAGTENLVGGAGIQEGTAEGTQEETTEQKEEVISSEAAELKQEFTDEEGRVVERVTANLPEGAFNAEASQITMEVNYPEEAAEKNIQDLMTKALPENDILGDYILYDIKFKVNGTVTEPLKPIAITFEGRALHIEDTKKANVFYLDPADPEVKDDKDEIIEITQRSEMIEALRQSGQTTENIEDYDLSDITVKEDGTADKIQMEGRISTVYGCYVEKTPEPVQTLTYEDEDVKVNVSADGEEIIPAGASLKVVPILKNAEETKEEYEEVENKIQEKAAEDEYDIAGFLAYDITFADADGNKVEPNGDVNVSIEYKKAALPEEVKAEDTEVTVLHLEEDDKGQVKEVVDMNESQQLQEMKTDNEQKVEKVEFATDSFSAFTIIWKDKNTQYFNITVNYVDAEGNPIDGKQTTTVQASNTSNSPLDLRQYADDIEGYTSPVIRVNNINGAEIQQLQFLQSGSGKKLSRYVKYSKTAGNSGWIDWLTRNNGDGTVKGNIYIVYTADSSGGGGNGGIALGTPDHNKYIKSNGAGNYTLSLDVTGKQTENVDPIDIVIVLDYSGSMKESMENKGSVSRIEQTRAAIKKLYEDLEGVSQKAEIEFSVVSFATDSAPVTGGWVNYSDFGKLFNDGKALSLDTMSDKCGGGTNWEAGIKLGKERLKRGSTNLNARKYFLFLSDGEPTYRDTQYSERADDYEEDRGKWGLGNTDPNKWNLGAAQKEVTNDNTITSAYGRYVINVAKSNENRDNACYQLATSMEATGTAYRESNETKISDKLRTPGFMQGTTTENLTKAFETIAANITSGTYTNVYMEDKLSEYVDFSENTNEKVYSVTKNSDGSETETELPSTDYKISLDRKNKTIRVDLLDGETLSQDTTYRLKYNVTVTEQAKAVYIEYGGYNGTVGDENTDAWDNKPATSSGKPGFHSNDKAVVGYTDNGEARVAEYKHPVVQVDTTVIEIPDKNPLNGSITKTMGTVEGGLYPINLEVKTRSEVTGENADVDVVIVIDCSNSMARNSGRLSQTKIAAKKFVSEFVGEVGTVNQKRRVAVVKFHNKASTVCEFTGNVNEIIKGIDDLTTPEDAGNAPLGGTNTEAGFKQAKSVADASGRTKEEYVIFLTDGVPTSRMTGDEPGGGYTNDDDGSGTSYKEYTAAVSAASALTQSVKEIYTIGFLNGYTSGSGSMDVANKLLSDTSCYYPNKKYSGNTNIANISSKDRWDTSATYNYSSGYFTITSNEEAGTKLEEIWKKLAGIINNQASGSNGDGWTVTDKMASNVTFKNLKNAEMNGHKLQLSDDGKMLTTTLEDGTSHTVAVFDSAKNTITWNLKAELADKSDKFSNGYNYTYSLTYYIDFEDTGRTEFRKTNDSTYIDVGEPGKEIYPDKMPFFVNIIGEKLISGTERTLAGAKFKVYRDKDKQNLIAEMTADVDGRFQFQVGQSDLTLTSEAGNAPESYTMTAYLEETEAPQGYQKDTMLHPVTIIVPNVTYQGKTIGTPQQGTPSGIASLAYANSGDNDMLVVSNDSLTLRYSNKTNSDWGIIKRSASNNEIYLSGAVFGLYKKTDDNVAGDASYVGTSDKTGLIGKWKDVGGNTDVESKFIPAGTYILRETTAPVGYSLSTDEWTVTIASSGEVRISDKSGTVLEKIEADKLPAIEGLSNDGAYFYYDNAVLYELPSAGGSGIYWYMIGGVLLMLAGVLILYKNKRRGVLEK